MKVLWIPCILTLIAGSLLWINYRHQNLSGQNITKVGVNTSDWEIFSSPSYDYEFKYPKDWHVYVRSDLDYPALRQAYVAPSSRTERGISIVLERQKNITAIRSELERQSGLTISQQTISLNNRRVTVMQYYKTEAGSGLVKTLISTESGIFSLTINTTDDHAGNDELMKYLLALCSTFRVI